MTKEKLKFKKLVLINLMLENGYDRIIDNELLKVVKQINALQEGGVN